MSLQKLTRLIFHLFCKVANYCGHRRHCEQFSLHQEVLNNAGAVSWGAPPPPVFGPKKSKLARIIVENKNSSPRALKMSLQPGETFLVLRYSPHPNPLCFSNTMSSLKSCHPLVSKGLLRPCKVIKVRTRIDVTEQ